ncbi:spermine/spermidine synthase [Paenibacillus sp.]|jgi:spermidine synthase|uniref:spermine/spermidine synthase domain-containing protein n=1 Tax=Paenibacillus sp. TaxID=58172 RepID=UPI0028335FDE|nr:spermine/spermidine synthase [Paenibacillus sp.]MDR0269526.1 spermine/spermidine synthase [Paenibacillus sp.]
MYHEPEVIERFHTDRGDIQLQKREDHYEIIYNGTFLMATYNGESERLLVSRALERCKNPCKIMIGGLGVGFSLEEALTDSRVSKVDVVEIEEAIIQWNRTYLAQVSGHALDNPRAKVIHTDLVKWINETHGTYDAICLDIDNGPDWTVSESNTGLYSEQGINALIKLLRYNGVISYWSATESTEFVDYLKLFFEEVEVEAVPQPRGEPDYIYLASSPKIKH